MKGFAPGQIIYPKDIMRLTGKGERYARSTYKKIKDYYKKESHQLLTLSEFCLYFGISRQDIIPNEMRSNHTELEKRQR